jgi:hypothetical protein
MHDAVAEHALAAQSLGDQTDLSSYFDARETKDMISSDCEIVSDDVTWMRLRAEQPRYLSELDYLVSVDALRRRFGYRN